MKQSLAAIIVLIICSGSLWSQGEFIATWKTDRAYHPDDSTILLPFRATPSTNYSLDWDNDGILDTTGLTGPVILTLDAPGTYTIRVSGTFPSFYYTEEEEEEFDRVDQLLSVDQWGDNTWDTLSFNQCRKLTLTAVDIPDLSALTSMKDMFRAAIAFDSPINHWDVSNVTDMSGMFAFASNFNQPLDNWNVSNVTDMEAMFLYAASFNQPLNNWDVGSVMYMQHMFAETQFNQPLNLWQVDSVKSMLSMFFGNSAFNQPIGNWNVGNVTDMNAVFFGASSFAQDISSWDVSNVQQMSGMFQEASAFNQSISTWDVSHVTDMSFMFSYATSFDQPLNGWSVDSVTNLTSMFEGAASFNQPLDNWNVSSVTSMELMFYDAFSFDKPLGAWDVGNVMYLNDMFSGVTLSTANYDDLLIGWRTTAQAGAIDFHGGFSEYCTGVEARQFLIDSLGWSITDGGINCTKTFVTTWKTNNNDNPSDKTIYVPVVSTPSTNYSIDWDMDGVPDTSGLSGPVLLTFDAPGTYQISMSGDFPEFEMNGLLNRPPPPITGGDTNAVKLLSVDQWGDNAWEALAFRGSRNLVINAVDTPNLTNATSLRYLFFPM